MADPNLCMATLCEKDMLNDFLAGQKQITASYNTFAGECMDPQLRNTFLNILDEEHRIQAELFQRMSAKGWYTADPAEPQKIAQTRQKLGSV